MSARIKDDSMKMSGTSTLTRKCGTAPYVYLIGEVKTPIGIVTIYSQEKSQGLDALTRLDFVCGGRLFMRTIYRTFTERGLATTAHRFAKQITRKP